MTTIHKEFEMSQLTANSQESIRPNPVTTLLRQAQAINKPLTTFTITMAVISIAAFVGIFLDARTIVGQPAWAKTFKFATSFVLYGGTLLWFFSYIQQPSRFQRFFLNATAAILSFEMVLLVTQAVRGRAMHFNFSTPLDSALYTSMAISIYALFVISLIAAALILRQPLPGRSFAWSLRLGLLVTVAAGFGLGNLMTAPTSAQTASMAAGEPGAGSVMGAHTVGAEDGGPGLPILGWSTEHGDLRIGHFFGLHALQAIPLLGLAISRRRETWLTDAHRITLVAIGALTYVGWLALVTWQALRGQSIVAPDGATLAAAAGLVSAAVGTAALTVGHAWRRGQ
jgi:hypothetical protein